MNSYLAMEEWFHNNNGKDGVRSARNNIVLVLRSVQQLFPRSGKTNSCNIPKMHGMTKIQEYMKLFGSGMNFDSGLGKATHKTFVKLAGQKTQRRVSEFAKQTANQYYYMMLTEIAVQSCIAQSSQLTLKLPKLTEKKTETPNFLRIQKILKLLNLRRRKRFLLKLTLKNTIPTKTMSTH